MRLKTILIIAIALAFSAIWGCSAGISSLESGDEGDLSDALQLVTMEGEAIGDPVHLDLGESFSFSVRYKGAPLKFYDCKELDPNGNEVGDGSYGQTTFNDTVCTHTAPSIWPADLPTGGVYYIDATVETVPRATARLRIALRESGGGSCRTTRDCRSGEFCYYGGCMPWEYAGVDISKGCQETEDCGGEPFACVPFDTKDGCVSYCTDLSKFLADELGPPKAAASCEAVGGIWSDEMGFCIPADVLQCMETNQCKPNLYLGGECQRITDREECNSSYAVYFDQGDWDVPYKYQNCYFMETGRCAAKGECEGGSGGYPHAWPNFDGLYTFDTKGGGRSSEACTPYVYNQPINQFEIVLGGDPYPCVMHYTDPPHPYQIVYNCDSYDPTQGTAVREGGQESIKVYLEGGYIKLIFLNSPDCRERGYGRVYYLTEMRFR